MQNLTWRFGTLALGGRAVTFSRANRADGWVDILSSLSLHLSRANEQTAHYSLRHNRWDVWSSLSATRKASSKASQLYNERPYRLQTWTGNAVRTPEIEIWRNCCRRHRTANKHL